MYGGVNYFENIECKKCFLATGKRKKGTHVYWG